MAKIWKTTYCPEDLVWVDCPLCESTVYSRMAEEWSLGVVRCCTCGLVYINPRIKEPEKNIWGGKDDIIVKYGAIFEGTRPHDRDRNYIEHIRTLKALKPCGRLLDIGTHGGFFLRMARGQEWDLYGVEPSPSHAALAREKFGLNVRCGYLEEGTFPEEFFDIVTMIDVLEHITQPLRVLQAVRQLLKRDGVLFLKVPNVRWNFLKYRILAKLLRLEHFNIFDSREHVVHYSTATLTAILQKAGFVVKRFYVPRPIQSGQWWKRGCRFAAWQLGRAAFYVSGDLTSVATDIACVAEKESQVPVTSQIGNAR